MFLFILESIGTAELLVIGIIALIFLGPRRLPEIARKIGKIMAEFRGTANDFKQTWEREVDIEGRPEVVITRIDRSGNRSANTTFAIVERSRRTDFAGNSVDRDAKFDRGKR
jgi:Tat protein translocase TatB subunit